MWTGIPRSQLLFVSYQDDMTSKGSDCHSLSQRIVEIVVKNTCSFTSVFLGVVVCTVIGRYCTLISLYNREMDITSCILSKSGFAVALSSNVNNF